MTRKPNERDAGQSDSKSLSSYVYSIVTKERRGVGPIGTVGSNQLRI